MIIRLSRKSSIKFFLTTVLAFTLCLLLSPRYQARAQAAWQILLNGSVSKTQILETEGGRVVPIYFPVPEEGESVSYAIQMESDPLTKQLKIEKVKKDRKARDVGDCPKCDGASACQNCYPSGSGVNTVGEECYWCNGTGQCASCDGNGKCYSCDGVGFDSGCNTCGMVSEDKSVGAR